MFTDCYHRINQYSSAIMPISDMQIYIDEAGRGPIAGPVVVGLVIGSESTDRSGYQDSKSLTMKQREQLADRIKSDSSIIRATGSASAKEIDRNGIIWGLKWAVIRGLYQLIQKSGFIIHNQKQAKQCYRKALIQTLGTLQILGTCELIIDGNHTFGLDVELGIPVQTIIKGDRDIAQISAASILAKTTRDHEMVKLGSKYPGYGFETHMGYGTSKHYEAIKQLGCCEIHRRKWIKNL